MDKYVQLKMHFDTTNEDVYEYKISNNEVTIVNYLGTNAEVTIPEVIEGYPVTTLGSSSFITNLTLERIELSVVVRIEARAFAGCTSLTTVTGNDVTSIGSYVFYNCKALKNISIANVKSLGQYCFGNCSDLERIDIPLIQEMPSFVLSKCYGLKDITLPSAKTIGSYAFEKCEALSYIDTPEVTAIDEAAFCYSGMVNADFPRVESANDEAFLNCQVLQAINMPTLEALGDHVFMDSDAQCICLSKELTQIGEEVFTGTEVKGLTIDYGTEAIDSVTEADWYTFANRLTGIDVETIMGRYIKNNVAYTSFTKGDTEAPVITLNGASTMTLEVGLSNYIELGATVTDNSCEVIESVILGSVDTSRIGHYSITYNATDSSGNQAIPVSRTVDVVDTTAPVITLNGANPMTLEVGVSNYSELGASVTDNSGEIIQPIISGSVDTKKIGQYAIVYTATDYSYNESEVVRVVNVIDTIAPVITLKGDAVMTLEVGVSNYIEPGVTVTDNSGEAITAVISSDLNIYKVGQYIITYNATDSSGNQAIPVRRTINVIDTTAPVIYLKGNNPMNVEVGSPSYIDPGVTVKDNSGEAIQPVVSGVVDTYKIGGYTLIYNATDSSGNQAIPVSRRVNVVDTTAPVITLNGDNPMTLEVGITVYNEPGATVKDNSGELVKLLISGAVNTKKIGKYAITYTATDSSGNKAEVIRTVNVTDTIAPLVTLNGANPMSLEVGLSTYSEPGVNVSDYSGEVIVPVIVGTVDTSKVGQYFITYTATDSSGNQKQVIRTVNVIDTTIPVITLIGGTLYILTINQEYQDPGVVITDNSGETIVPVILGTVNNKVYGEYVLTYTATDSSGNQAIPVTRSVKVTGETVIKCAQVVTYVTDAKIINWQIILLDGTQKYSSDDKIQYDTWHLQLSTLGFSKGTQFRIKLHYAQRDLWSEEVLEYVPQSNTVVYKSPGVTYVSTIASAESPPIQKASSVSVDNSDTLVSSYQLRLADTGTIIYTSDKYYREQMWNKPLSEVSELVPGTRLIVHSDVQGGADSEPYDIIEYQPSDGKASFTLIGNAFKTLTMIDNF